MQEIRARILSHLSAQEDTWASTVAKVTKEVGMSGLQVERAMRAMTESGEIKRSQLAGVTRYTVPRLAEKKTFTEKRQELEAITKSGTFETDPFNKDIKGPEAV